jgi:hypothetical protein
MVAKPDLGEVEYDYEINFPKRKKLLRNPNAFKFMASSLVDLSYKSATEYEFMCDPVGVGSAWIFIFLQMFDSFGVMMNH